MTKEIEELVMDKELELFEDYGFGDEVVGVDGPESMWSEKGVEFRRNVYLYNPDISDESFRVVFCCDFDKDGNLIRSEVEGI